MKKILILIGLAFLSMSVSAQYMHWSSRHGPYYEPARSWVAPVLIGGVIGYELSKARSNTVIIQQQPTIIEQTMECTPWKETLQSDGTTKRERTCYQR